MTLDKIDKSQLILESYRIEGITGPECRSIFLDWALKLPAEFDQRGAIAFLVQVYGGDHPDHPMTAVLRDGLETAAKAKRRGGRAARVTE
jgi:hypothetical protein